MRPDFEIRSFFCILVETLFLTKIFFMSDSLQAMLSQYEKNKQSGSQTQRVSSEERLKKYFAPILKGQASGERRIRILPSPDQGTPFKEVYFHEIQVDGKWVKLYDPGRNEGKRSPLNEVNQALRNTGLDSDKELAKNYNPKKFYIVKVIDRDNEQDGVKFWRFKHNSKGEGVFDKLASVAKLKGEVWNPEKGRDVILSLSLTKKPNGGEYTNITSIIPDDPSPLHTDAEKMKEWAQDALTWEDVYSKKPEEYLEGVAKGYVPKWNSDTKKWVYGEEAEADLSAKSSQPVDPQDGDDVDEDLPF